MALTLDTTRSLAPANPQAKLQAELQKLQQAAEEGGYNNEYASINLPADELFLEQSEQLAKSLGHVDLVIVIGIGGSNLGTMAVHEAVNGRFHNGFRRPGAYFADTVDADMMRDLCKFIELYLQHNMRVVLNVISKSGGTTETIANFEVLQQPFIKHGHKPVVVATTDEGSPLWKFAKEHGYYTLPIPQNVGGRYSVLSNVGLFPLTLLGIDCRELLHGAADIRELCLQEEDNPAMRLAQAHFHHASAGRNIADLFLFGNDLESLGKWYRQLVAESLGKQYSKSGQQVWSGITPTVSIGSTDLHSMGQLYLGGPQDKFTTFVTIQQVSETAVPDMQEYEKLVPHIQRKKLHGIMDAIVQGVQSAYTEQRRPHATITLSSKSAYDMGQFLQLQMMQVIYLASLMEVNPFDQPNVELYKKETKRILKEK